MAITADEEEVDQDPAEITAPQVQMPVSAPVTAPGSVPVVPPQFQRAPGYDPEAVGRNISMRRLLNSMGDAPIDEAEKAVATAMKFQAIRGYQRDLANGTPASEALAKWAPSMFSQPKAGTLGQAASLVRATRPDAEKYMDIGGVGYQMKGGKAIPLTPPKAVRPKTVPLVLPADPENPMTGGHITVQVDPDDPMVKKALDRARTGPPPPTPEPPGIFSRIKDTIFGAKPSQVAAPGPVPTVPSSTPVPAVIPPASPVRTARPTTPEEKLAAARALRASHPDWTKKQILDAVNQ